MALNSKGAIKGVLNGVFDYISRVGSYLNIRIASSVYGNYPATWFLGWEGVVSAVVATPIYTSGDVSVYNNHTFEAVTATAKVEAQVTSAGTWLAVSVLVDGVESATIAAGSVGVLKGKYYAVRMKPNAATSTNGFGSHGVV